MKGKVKSFRETYYSVHEDFGLVKKSSRLNDPIFHDQLVSFDQNGNITETVEYNFDGTIYSKFKGRCDYNDNNIETLYVRFYPVQEFDKKQFIIESVTYSLGKHFEMRYKNDSLGHPVEESITDQMGRELYKIMIRRDEKGNSVEEKFSNGSAYRYRYDKNGNRIEWIKGAGGDTTKTYFKYDQSGNIIEMKIDNYYKSSYKYQYDKYKYKYRYDRHGNWIKRTDFDNDLPVRIVVREIVYAGD